MKSFKDTAGLSWSVSVNVGSIKRVRTMADVDLLAIADGKMIDRLYQDPIALVDVLWAICQPEVVQRQTTPEQFATAIAGDVLDDATTALVEDLRDFFPKSRRAVLGQVILKIQEGSARATELATAKIAGMDIAGIVAKAMERAENSEPLKQSGDTAGSSPEPSESTPIP
jgi:hypothetical protein